MNKLLAMALLGALTSSCTGSAPRTGGWWIRTTRHRPSSPARARMLATRRAWSSENSPLARKGAVARADETPIMASGPRRRTKG